MAAAVQQQAAQGQQHRVQARRKAQQRGRAKRRERLGTARKEGSGDIWLTEACSW